MIENLYASALEAEADFDARLLDPDEAVAAATAAHAQTRGRPAVIADVQDNPGAGGTSQYDWPCARAYRGAGKRHDRRHDQ